MRKKLTTISKRCAAAAAGMVCLCAFQTQAQYMTDARIDPANNSTLDNMGGVAITWPQYRLDLGNTEDKTPVNLPLDKVTLYINDVENTTWKDGMGVSLQALNAATTNETTGEEYPLAEIYFYPGTAAFWWSGTIRIVMEEGLVTTTTGEISPSFDLTYYVGAYSTVSPAVWTPAQGAVFNAGEAEAFVSWRGRTPESVNVRKVRIGLLDSEGDVWANIYPDDEDCSIVGNEVKFDLSSLDAGRYILTLEQGAVNLGANYVNGEDYYSFSVEDSEANGVKTIEAVDAENGTYYDLQGRRVLNPERGIFIRNGEKIIKR